MASGSPHRRRLRRHRLQPRGCSLVSPRLGAALEHSMDRRPGSWRACRSTACPRPAERIGQQIKFSRGLFGRHEGVTPRALAAPASWVEHEAGVAIGLIGAPGVGGRKCVVGTDSRQLHGLAEEVRHGEEAARRTARRRRGGVVVDRPTRRHDGAHAHVDQLARCWPPGGCSQGRLRVHHTQVAAVQEDEIGHLLHLPDLGGSEEHAVGQHHATARVGPSPGRAGARQTCRAPRCAGCGRAA